MSIETLLEAAKFVEWSSQIQHGTRDDSRAEKSKLTSGEQPAPVPAKGQAPIPTKGQAPIPSKGQAPIPVKAQPVIPAQTGARARAKTPPAIFTQVRAKTQPPIQAQPQHHTTPKPSPATTQQHVSPTKTTSRPPAGLPMSPSRTQQPAWTPAPHTSPRPLDQSSLVSNRPVLSHPSFPVAISCAPNSPQRAVTPPSAVASFTGVQYRPLAPVPAHSPNGSNQSSQPYVTYHHRQRYDSTASNQSEDSMSADKNDDKKHDTREVHNKLEKNRRAHLKDCFDNLKAQVPNMEDKKIKTSNLSILQGALRYLQALKRKERELEHQLDKLARQKITYQQRLAKLKMEKRLTDDQLPWNRRDESEEEEMEEDKVEDDDQASTSTASEAEEEERKSRANSPGLSPPPQSQLPKQSKSTQHRKRTHDTTTKGTHSVTKEIHSGPYVISRHIISHMAQPTTANRQSRTETLPIISQLARKQAVKPVIGAFEERRSTMSGMGKNPYATASVTTGTTSHSTSHVGASAPNTTQYVGVTSQSGSRQTVSQLLGKQTPIIRAPARHAMPNAPNMPTSYTPVIQAPLRHPLASVVYPAGIPVVGVTAPPTAIASQQIATTSAISITVSKTVGTTSVIYSSAMTKSVIQPTYVTTTGSALKTITPSVPSAQAHTPINSVTIAPAQVTPTALPPRTVTPSFISPFAMPPSALTQVLFTQPPVAAYSLAQTQLASSLIPSALHQTVIPPSVAVTTVTQSVITQIISTQPVSTLSSGKVSQATPQTITTPAIASMVPQSVAPYPQLLGVPSYALGPPLAFSNKALVTTSPAYTTLPLGSAAALQKLQPLPFHAPGAIPMTAGAAQTALLPLTGLNTGAPRPPHVAMTTVAMTAAIAMTTPATSFVSSTPAIRPRLPVDTRTLTSTPAPVMITTTAQVPLPAGMRTITPTIVRAQSPTIVRAPSPTIVRAPSPTIVRGQSPTIVRTPGPYKKDKPQKVTTSQMAQILASNKSIMTKPATSVDKSAASSSKHTPVPR